MYPLMLAFILLSGGLITAAINTVWPNALWYATIAHFTVGLIMIVLAKGYRVAHVMRVAGGIFAVLGTMVIIFYGLPNDIAWLRDYHANYPGQHWWENGANWLSGWIELGLIVQILLVIGLGVFALIRLNAYFLTRETARGGRGSSVRPAA